MRIVLTGGGTGGHIYPALAIGREVKEREPDSAFLYIGAARGLESRIVPQQQMPFKAIDITGFRRSLSMDNVKTIWRFLQGVKLSKKLLREFRPDVVVGTGGYVCGPVVYAASRLGIPTVIHEQNVVPGLTNKFLSRYVNGVAVSFAESKPYFAGCGDVIFAGNPCASAVLRGDRSAGFASLGLSPDTPFVLVVGGSGGARALNEAAADMAASIEELPGVHLILVTGDRFYEDTRERVEKLGSRGDGRVRVLPYVHNMPEVLAAASLVVSRAGASLLAEITALGVPSILVPSPNVTNNHQEPNARSVADAGAGEMILERELGGGKLRERVFAIMKDAPLRRRMSEASKSLGMPQAAADIYAQLKRVGSAGRRR